MMEQDMETTVAIVDDEEVCRKSLSAVNDAMYVIGGKWRIRVIISMRKGITRFNELQKDVSGISARMLSMELKEMELTGFVNRRVDPLNLKLVEYELTPYSDTLGDVLKALNAWGTMHREKIRNERN